MKIEIKEMETRSLGRGLFVHIIDQQPLMSESSYYGPYATVEGAKSKIDELILQRRARLAPKQSFIAPTRH